MTDQPMGARITTGSLPPDSDPDRARTLVSRSCPTCRSIGPRILVLGAEGGPGDAQPCDDPWHGDITAVYPPGYPPQSGTPADVALMPTTEHGRYLAELRRYRNLLTEALTGWSAAAELGPHEPGRQRARTRIAEIRREVNLP